MVNADKPDAYSLLKTWNNKDERDLLDNPCLNIKIGTEILYNHFSRCGVTWQCLGTYNAGFAMDNQKRDSNMPQNIHCIYQA